MREGIGCPYCGLLCFSERGRDRHVTMIHDSFLAARNFSIYQMVIIEERPVSEVAELAGLSSAHVYGIAKRGLNNKHAFDRVPVKKTEPEVISLGEHRRRRA